MVGILENIRVTLRKSKDLNIIIFFMVEGLTHNKGEEGGGFFEKDLKRKGFIKEKKEGQGPKGKTAFLPPLITENRGGAMGRRRPWARGPGGMAAARDRGKGQVDAGIRFPSSISEEGARREGCGGHGRGGPAAAMDGVVGVARGEHR